MTSLLKFRGIFLVKFSKFVCNDLIANECLCRWELPELNSGFSASTANELRRDRLPPTVNSEKLKAAAEGLQQSRSKSCFFILALLECFFLQNKYRVMLI